MEILDFNSDKEQSRTLGLCIRAPAISNIVHAVIESDQPRDASTWSNYRKRECADLLSKAWRFTEVAPQNPPMPARALSPQRRRPT